MKHILSMIFLLTMLVGCQEKKETNQPEPMNEAVEQEIKEIDNEIEELDSLNIQIEKSSEKLDDMLNELND
ncbi:hypothetical protein [Dokdonia sp. Hel_I_53]|uniref:hypothetical protein n=1 Tax=Dokdonia sp. Hel_I_53 TaxID=1566287 RepID=UPI00119A08CC|nr:hypothetical protein [Dokdonia sp. Hel_I_53]TVZ53007.1 hypothetical protein OD90_2197 [Dokdonia sp. Hel_I_53]